MFPKLNFAYEENQLELWYESCENEKLNSKSYACGWKIKKLLGRKDMELGLDMTGLNCWYTNVYNNYSQMQDWDSLEVKPRNSLELVLSND